LAYVTHVSIYNLITVFLLFVWQKHCLSLISINYINRDTILPI